MPKDQTYSSSITPSSDEESFFDFYDDEDDESEEDLCNFDEEQNSEDDSVDEESLSEDSDSMLISMQDQQNSDYFKVVRKLFNLCEGYDDSDITADEALQWIHREQPTYTEEFTDLHGYMSPLEYPTLDCEKLAYSLSEDDFVVVINSLLDEYVDAEKTDDYQFLNPYQYRFDFTTLKDLIKRRTEIMRRTTIGYDINLIDMCCIKTIKNNDIDEFNFFYELNPGSSEEVIFEAIKRDASEFLEVLDPTPTQEYIQFAIKNKSDAAIEYFFSSHSFADTSELVLSMAIEKLRSHRSGKARNLVRKVCHYANLEHTYDLILFLVKKGGESLVELFLKSFGVEELLTEIQEQDGDRGLLNVVLEKTKAFVAQQGWERGEIETLISQFDGTLRFTPTSLIYPANEFEGEPRLAKIRKVIDNDFSFSEERRTAASLIGIRLCTTNHYLNSETPYHPSDPQTSEAYFRSSHHPLSILVGPNKARYSVSEKLPETNAKQGNGREAHMGLYKHPVDSLTKSVVSKKNV